MVVQVVKDPPALWETWVPSLGWEDPLQEGMATHCSILAWRTPMARGAWWARVHGAAKSQTTERLRTARAAWGKECPLTWTEMCVKDTLTGVALSQATVLAPAGSVQRLRNDCGDDKWDCEHMSKLTKLYSLIMCSFLYINYTSIKLGKQDTV